MSEGEELCSLHGHEVGSVVWFKTAECSWWPCKVHVSEEGNGVGLLSFGDAFFYFAKKCSAKNMREFGCEEAMELVKAVKKKNKTRKETLDLFHKAVDEAVEYVQQGDPSFSLSFDHRADISILSDTSFTGSTPGGTSNTSFRTPLRSANVSIFTTGTDSKTGKTSSVNGTQSKRKSAIKSLAVEKSPSSDFLVRSSRRKRGRQRENESGRKKARVSTKGSSQDGGGDGVAKKIEYEDEEGEREKKKKKTNKRSSVVRGRLEGSPRIGQEDILGVIGRDGSRQNGGKRSCTPGSRDEQGERDAAGEVDRLTRDQIISKGGEKEGSSGSTQEHSSKEKETDSVSGDASPKPPSVSKDDKMVDISSAQRDTHPSSLTNNGGADLTSFLESTCDRLRDSDEDMESLKMSDSEDDDLPDVDFDVNESVKIYELKPKEIVWAKFKQHPFWPAMVVNVKTPKKSQKSKSEARIIFFGYGEAESQVRIKNKRNLAPFGTKRREEYLKEGRDCVERNAFNQAYDEANTLLSLRVNEEVQGSPLEQFQMMVERRPKEFKPLVSPVLAKATGKDESPQPAAGEESGSESPGQMYHGDEEDSEDDMQSSDEEEDPNDPYSWERIMAVVTQLKPELVGITKGTVHSDLHNTYLRGSAKEKARLKATFPAPLTKWRPKNKKQKLFNELTAIAQESLGGSQMMYVMNVLLAEATVRIISKIENIPISEAANRL